MTKNDLNAPLGSTRSATTPSSWSRRIVKAPIIGVGKIYDHTGLCVIYPYVYLGNVEYEQLTLQALPNIKSIDEVVRAYKIKATVEFCRTFSVRHNLSGHVVGFAAPLFNEKYSDIWSFDTWGALPSFENENIAAPRVQVGL